MHRFALSPVRKLLVATAAAAFLFLTSTPSQAQPDPPAEAGRLSYITGNVSYQPVGSSDWGQAFSNLPLGPGDRIFTDDDSRAEIQVGQTFLRIGPNSDVSLINSTPTGITFGVAQGSVHFHIHALWDGQSIYVNTPSGSARASIPGQMRVDVIPDEDATVFTVFGGGSTALIAGAGGFSQTLQNSQTLELAGSNPVVPQWMQPADWDALDKWNDQREREISGTASYRYVSPEIPGAYELEAAGTWQPGTPYGAVWFPNNVQAGWAPYHNGHWINHSPWGWVWVEDESWGYAPFHYGRWVSLNGRWGWVAGPPAAHPVWSPALVVFAGGQPGVSAWFPLGPGEPYRPWYPCSPHYVDVVNISNITVTNVVHVQTTYVNVNLSAVVYANRSIGVTAVSNADFAAGKPAAQVAVKVDAHAFEHVQVLAAPEPRPTPQSIIGHPPARPVRVSAARPVLINSKGMAVAAAPGDRPAPPPVKPAPAIKPLPGHKTIAPPTNAAKPQTPGKTAPSPATEVPAKAVPAEKPSAPTAPKSEVKEKAQPEAKTPPRETDKTPAKPTGKPSAPAATKPEVKEKSEPEAKTPARPAEKTPAEPTGKQPAPAATKPAGQSATPSKDVKPGTTPAAKTDKDKKDDKNKNDKDKDKGKKDDKDKDKKDEPSPQ